MGNSRKKKNILLTFDFELFLGSRSGTVDKCMIQPTLQLMDIVMEFKLSVVFFVDTLYLYRLRELSTVYPAAEKDYKRIVDLLRSIIDSGGYVFHHIHPHWLDAVYLHDINQWDGSNKQRFSLSNLSGSEIEDVFFKSDAIISDIYSHRKKPEAFGFRAGGLYAQPFDSYQKSMEMYNILLEFSVLRNAQSKGDTFSFNYSNCPKADVYTFSNNLLVKQDGGGFTEITMNQFILSGLYKIINGIYYRLNFRKKSWKPMGDGAASGNKIKSVSAQNKFFSEETFSVELLNHFKSILYLNFLKNNNYIHLISHPKLFSKDNLEAFRFFISKSSAKYDIETDVFKIVKQY